MCGWQAIQTPQPEAMDSIERKWSTDVHLVVTGTVIADHIAPAHKRTIQGPGDQDQQHYYDLSEEAGNHSVEGLGVPFVPTRRGFLYILVENIAKALLELVQGLAKLVWRVRRLAGWNRDTGSALSSCGTAKHTLEGALQAETGGMLCREALHSMVLSSAMRTTCGPRVRIRSVANVHSPIVSTATSVQLVAGSPILPGFGAEAVRDLGAQFW